MSGNKYIIAFVDCFSGLPEAFAVPDKTADTVAHLLTEKLYPRFVFYLLLLPLWESVIVLCFIVHYFMSILVLQSS